MKIEIEVSDDELREYILTAAGKSLFAEWSVDRNLYKRTIADCVREVIYKDKDEIRVRILLPCGAVGVLPCYGLRHGPRSPRAENPQARG